MKALIQKVPVPIAGLTLGLTALGNLIAGLSPALRWGCGAAAAALFLLLILKLILFPAQIRRDLESPIIASVSATAFMTVMQLCSYVQPFSPTASLSVWYAAVAGHFALMIAFSLRFLRRFRLADVYPTYFIAFVGIVVASVTSRRKNPRALDTPHSMTRVSPAQSVISCTSTSFVNPSSPPIS